MTDDLLQQYGLLLIGIGASFFLILLLVALLRLRKNKRGLRPAAAMAVEESSASDDVPTAPVMPKAPATMPAAEEAIEASAGFKLFKRRKKRKNKQGAGQDDVASQLADIEQQMLALRELFRNGEIARSVYIAETKALYETARLLTE